MKRSCIFLLLLCSLLLLAACGPAADPEPIELFYRSDYHMESDLQGMYDKAAFVVIGQFGEFQSSWNMARDLNDSTQESTERRRDGHIYEFNVEQIIKNETDDLRQSIEINLPYSETKTGILPPEQTGGKKESSYSLEIPEDFYMQPKQNTRYMLFLSYTGQAFDLYYPTAEPYRIRIGEGDILSLESNLLLSDAEKEARSLHQGKAEGGEEIFVRTDKLKHSFDDQISGLTLQEALDQLGVENVFTFPN